MMKPYYEQDRITIYHGDCLELLPWKRASLSAFWALEEAVK